MRVLIAASDPAFAAAARLALRGEGLKVDLATDADDALDRAAAIPFDALVLDLDLPGSRGVDLLVRLGSHHVASFVLALTADTSPESRVQALCAGADDCLTKPLLMAELVARIHALTRRAGRKSGDCLEVEDLVIHCAKRRAFRANEALPLTEREFTALEHLVRAHGQPVSADILLALLWHDEEAPRDNFVAVLMMRLRQKVDAGREQKLIRTIRGQGYAVCSSLP